MAKTRTALTLTVAPKRAPSAKPGAVASWLRKHYAEEWAAVGGLSAPSKMPSLGYSTPAAACGVGSKLRPVKGSICNGCYALKGRYLFANVQAALAKRLAALGDLEGWESAMVTLLTAAHSRNMRYFRWHDSGDVQSLAHLHAINRIAYAVPGITFWLPTRESATLARFREPETIVQLPSRQVIRANPVKAPNLTIRYSLPLVDVWTVPPIIAGMPVSGVFAAAPAPQGTHVCPAPQQGGHCGDCRACWDADCAVTGYHVH